MNGAVSTKASKEKSAEQSGNQSSHTIERPTPSGPYADMMALQRAAGNQAVSEMLQPEMNDVPPIVHEVLNSGNGQPLEPTMREFMESRFGHDFSQVRVHTDAQAVESAEDIDAQAYTVGQDVVFGKGQYLPETQNGRDLIAHELAHVVQQERGGTVPSLNPQASHEHAAASAAQMAVHGTSPVTVESATGVGIARAMPATTRSTQPSKRVYAAIQLLQRAQKYYFANPPDKEKAHRIVQAVHAFTRDIVSDTRISQLFAGPGEYQARLACDFSLGAVHRLESSFISGLSRSSASWNYDITQYAAGQRYLEVLAGDATPERVNEDAREAAKLAAIVYGVMAVSIIALPFIVEGIAIAAPIIAEEALLFSSFFSQTGVRLICFAGRNPVAATVLGEFTVGTVFSIVSAGGLTEWLEGLQTREGQDQFAVSLVEFIYSYRSATGPIRTRKASGIIEGHNESTITIRLKDHPQDIGESQSITTPVKAGSSPITPPEEPTSGTSVVGHLPSRSQEPPTVPATKPIETPRPATTSRQPPQPSPRTSAAPTVQEKLEPAGELGEAGQSLKGKPNQKVETEPADTAGLLQTEPAMKTKPSHKDPDPQRRIRAEKKAANTQRALEEAEIEVEGHDPEAAANAIKAELKELGTKEPPCPPTIKARIDTIDSRPLRTDEKMLELDKIAKEPNLSEEAKAYLEWKRDFIEKRDELRGVSKGETKKALENRKVLLETQGKRTERELSAASKTIGEWMREEMPNYKAKGEVNFDEVMESGAWEARKSEPVNAGKQLKLNTDHVFPVAAAKKSPQMTRFLEVYIKASATLKARMKESLKVVMDRKSNLCRMEERANQHMKKDREWHDISYAEAREYGYSREQVDKWREKGIKVRQEILGDIDKLTDDYSILIGSPEPVPQPALE